jgi:hypothetical protein
MSDSFLDEPVPEVEFANVSVATAARRLRFLGYRVCFEEPQMRGPNLRKISLHARGATLRAVLNDLVRLDDYYRWERVPGTDAILIRPVARTVKSRLDIRVRIEQTQEMTVHQALLLSPDSAMALRGPRASLDHLLLQRVTIRRGRYAFREVLNQILAQHDMYWVMLRNSERINWMPRGDNDSMPDYEDRAMSLIEPRPRPPSAEAQRGAARADPD